MILELNINLELEDSEIKFLKLYLKDRGLSINRILYVTDVNNSNKYLPNHGANIHKLKEIGLVREDNMCNVTLTYIGNLVLDRFDRDKKISNILKK